MRCSKCGVDSSDGSRFCGNCGAPLEKNCPQCGANNLLDKRFCGDCGALLTVYRAAEASSLAQRSAQVRAATEESAAVTPTDGERRHLTVLFSDLVNSTEI